MSTDKELQEEFISCIEQLAESAHGCKELVSVRTFCKEKLNKHKKKIPERAKFLSDLMIRTPIRFEEVKEKVWSIEEEREKNRFPFIQGDIVKTTVVSTLGLPRSQQEIEYWIVLTPSCDIVRKEYVQVSPLY